ncbi:hypothetical protein [Krasilnikovia sp. MM14-A1259]|uniref:hypothetical protein n=1 Tax=Krasilnikovia sp. MM14-A1259 TaxID=3373539 RepID=UPI00381D7E31
MQHLYARRTAGALTVAGALLATLAAPAYAETGEQGISADLAFVDVVAGAAAGSPQGLNLRSKTKLDLTEVKIAYEVTGLAGLQLVVAPGSGICTSESPTRIVCSDPRGLSLGQQMVEQYLPIVVKAAPTAKPDAYGKLMATFSAKGVAPITATAAVRVLDAEENLLAAGADLKVEARPGGTFVGGSSVRNAGDVPFAGAGVMISDDFAIEPGTTYSNCTYVAGHLESCTFDQELAPGAQYDFTMPLRLRTDTYAPGFTPSIGFDWRPSDFMKKYRWHGKPGIGGVLKLVPHKGAVDTAKRDMPLITYVDVTTTGTNYPDIAAVGAQVKGGVGDVVTASVGVTDRGPAVVDFTNSARMWGGSHEQESVAVDLTVPPGTTVVSVPRMCWELVDGKLPKPMARGYLPDPKPGFSNYRCTAGPRIPSSTAESPNIFDFTLRIDKVIPGSAGTVEVNKTCNVPNYRTSDDTACTSRIQELNPDNNTAPIVVNAPGGGSTDAGKGGNPAGGVATGAGKGGNPAGGQAAGTASGGQAAGGGSSLPITGPTAGIIGGAGLLMLGAGVVSVLVARRRRDRFVA